MPSTTPSLRLRWVTSTLADSEPSSTAKLWFWLVISTVPVASRRTGWLPPWWPNGSLKVVGAEGGGEQLVAEADAEDRHLAEQLADASDGVAGDRGRVAGAVREEHAVGLAGEDLGGRRGGGHDLDGGDPPRWRRIVRLDAEVVGDDRAAPRDREPTV